MQNLRDIIDLGNAMYSNCYAISVKDPANTDKSFSYPLSTDQLNQFQDSGTYENDTIKMQIAAYIFYNNYINIARIDTQNFELQVVIA